MKFIKNFILILLFILPISNSFGAMVTHNQTVMEQAQAQIELDLIITLIKKSEVCSLTMMAQKCL